MKIVCDSNLPFAAEAFGTLGEVVLREGRAMTAADLRDAAMLITRSTTRVTRELLAGSRLRFYGSAVIGTDHIDTAYLEQAGIPWSAAPGCNAESVANYVTAALLELGGRQGFRLEGKTLGVIGVGNVGRRVTAHAQALGMRVLGCDPPRQRDPADAAARGFVALAELLEAAEIVTCHVPLTRDGADRTWHLLDRAALARVRRGVVVVNAARGEVVETDALLEALGARVAHAVIDTWEGEPRYRPDLLARAAIATPHIAGHSYEGKVNGTLYVYAQACRVLGVAPTFRPRLPPPTTPEWRADAAGREDEDVLREAVRAVYDVTADDARMRAGCVPDPAARAREFDRQRREYPMRREFGATAARVARAAAALRRKLAGVGFQLA